MRQVWRWVATISLTIVVAALSSCLTNVVKVLRENDLSRVALLQNLPRNFISQDAAFSDRLRRTFPVGSSEAVLMQTLQQQRFQADWKPASSRVRSASIRGGDFVCAMGADVVWQADQAGRLTEIHGRYGERGCL